MMRIVYKNLVRKSEGNRPLGRSRQISEVNVSYQYKIFSLLSNLNPFTLHILIPDLYCYALVISSYTLHN
jgi:hypothetical protein